MNITSYHKEEWSPAWSLRTMMQAIIGHFVVEDRGIGSITKSKEERQKLAKASINFKCSHCGHLKDIKNKYMN